jgi:hypothetical protein
MIIDELDDIKCEECYRLAIEDIAAFAIDPKRMAKFEAENPEEAAEVRASLRKLLDMPQASLQELVKALAAKTKARVGLLQS